MLVMKMQRDKAGASPASTSRIKVTKNVEAGLAPAFEIVP
jgi:hypothetical protein